MSTADDTTSQPTSSSMEASTSTIELTIHHRGSPQTYTFLPTATISDLSTQVADELSIPPPNQKFLITPKLGLLRPPFPDPTLPLSALTGKKIVLMGSTPAEISTLSSAASAAPRARARTPPVKPAAPARTRDHQRAKDDATYTFHTLRPLPQLPAPERALRFLQRLRDDAGIRAAMRAHRFSVPLLAEMDPAAHTTHDARTLGLNRNRGEVIELRLRTDAYDGYRDYRTVRKTLCHELAHNVWGEHDRDFWRLTAEIEGEVERNDWTSGGRALSTDEFYNPDDGGFDGDADHGGWTGGEFVLGGGGSSAGEVGAAGLSRREILARAAEERMRKTRSVEQVRRGGAGDGGGTDADKSS